MKIILFIAGCVLICIALLIPKEEEDPFFQKRCFKYYKDGELVAYEYKSYAKPAMYELRKLGLGVPEYDKIIVSDTIGAKTE